jgi:hypothetical protein
MRQIWKSLSPDMVHIMGERGENRPVYKPFDSMGARLLVRTRFILDAVVGVLLLAAAAYFWSDVNYARAISFGTGAIAIIAMADGILTHSFNHATDWAHDQIVIPIAKAGFIIASLSLGRTKPPTIDQLTEEIEKFKAKSDVIDAAFKDIIKRTGRRE